MNYTEPSIEVIEFVKKDIVCVSGLNGHSGGDGDYGSIKDWF